MFEYGEIEELAKQAKMQLEEQGSSIDNVNIYESLMNDTSVSDNTLNSSERPKSNYEDIYDIKRKSDEYEELPTLNVYDELLFPGGPTKLQVDTWKKDWNECDIYVTEILNKPFVFRTLNRYEYKQLVVLQDVDALQREEIICQTATLWPEVYTWKEMATTLAGLPSTYAEIIMEKSGFTKDYAVQVL